MAPKRHETMADLVIAKGVQNRQLNCLVPFFGLLWCTHPIIL